MDRDLAEEGEDETLDEARETDEQQPISLDDDEGSPDLVGGPAPCESQTAGTLGSAGTVVVAEKVRCDA